MPIIPVTKIPSVVPQFAEYSIINNIHFVFRGGESISKQPIPVHSFIDEETGHNVLDLMRNFDDSVEFPMPTNGIISKFRVFNIENTTAFTFAINFVNVTKTTTTVLVPVIRASTNDDNTLFTNNSLSIAVDKGDLVKYEIDFGTNEPVEFKHVHLAYMSLNFKSTSSA